MSSPYSPAGIQIDPVTNWFNENVAGAVAPFTFNLVAGGRSNLTFQVSDAMGNKFALRRPPLAHVVATAHDMGREYRIIAALNQTNVPVPRTYGLCDDPDVNDAPFYVMEFVDGLILRDVEVAEKVFPVSSRPAVGASIAQALAALHAVTVDAVGLGDLAKKEDYVARQIKRWSGQFDHHKGVGVVEPGAVERAGDALARAIPPQEGAAIVHGDFRIDNMILREDGSVAAILDWELCTLGDPLADVGTLVSHWGLPKDGQSIFGTKVSASTLPGFCASEELLDAYAKASGRDLSNISYYIALGYWRFACILQGVYARYVEGGGGGDPSTVDHYPGIIARLAHLCLDLLGES
jgi:aminoglycoside phosphotransferase (APT) family kinase protein